MVGPRVGGSEGAEDGTSEVVGLKVAEDVGISEVVGLKDGLEDGLEDGEDVNPSSLFFSLLDAKTPTTEAITIITIIQKDIHKNIAVLFSELSMA